jgi:hypothetical protein
MRVNNIIPPNNNNNNNNKPSLPLLNKQWSHTSDTQIKYNAFSTSTWDRDAWLASAPAVFCPEKMLLIPLHRRSQDSPIATATGYGVDGWGSGVRFPTGTRDFYLLHSAHTGFTSPQPPMQGVLEAFLLGVKRQKCEADHSHLRSAEVQNVADIPPLTHTSSWYNA